MLEEHDFSYSPKAIDDIPVVEDFFKGNDKVLCIYVCNFKHIFSRTLFDSRNNL